MQIHTQLVRLLISIHALLAESDVVCNNRFSFR